MTSIERTIARLNRCRRLAKDCTALAFLKLETSKNPGKVRARGALGWPGADLLVIRSGSNVARTGSDPGVHLVSVADLYSRLFSVVAEMGPATIKRLGSPPVRRQEPGNSMARWSLI